MYTYVSAIALANSFDGRYSPVDVYDMQFIDLFTQYRSVIVTLNRPGDKQEVSYDLADLPGNLRYTQTTLAEWLTMNQNNTLPTTEIKDEYQYTYVKARNAWRIGCTIRPYNINYHYDIPLTQDMEKDILISYPEADYNSMCKWGLYTVNGLLYPHNETEWGIAVLDCIDNVRHYNQTQVGFLDFSGIGEVETVDVDKSMITSQNGRPLRDGVIIKLNQPIGNKKVLLSIGGYLHALDGTYRPINDTAIRFDFPNYPWANRYFHLDKLTNTDHLKLTVLFNGAINTDELYSDEVIENLFSHHQTFVILVDTPDLRRGVVDLDPTHISGHFISHELPDKPLLSGDGRLLEYHHRIDYGKYLVTCENTWVENWLYEKTDYLRQRVVAKVKDLSDPYRLASGQLLTLSRVVQEE